MQRFHKKISSNASGRLGCPTIQNAVCLVVLKHIAKCLVHDGASAKKILNDSISRLHTESEAGRRTVSAQGNFEPVNTDSEVPNTAFPKVGLKNNKRQSSAAIVPLNDSVP